MQKVKVKGYGINGERKAVVYTVRSEGYFELIGQFQKSTYERL